MNTIFIQGCCYIIQDSNGFWYTESSFTKEVWDRYLSACDNLRIMLRRKTDILTPVSACSKYNIIEDTARMSISPMKDFTRGTSKIPNPMVLVKIFRHISNEIKQTDNVIIRSFSIYCFFAWLACKRYKKKYLIEITGFIAEGFLFHKTIGRIVGPIFDFLFKIMVKKADYAVYITDYVLQNTYPTNGIQLACSDVELEIDRSDDVVEKRKLSYVKDKKKITLGTIGGLSMGLKGQDQVVRALAILKQQLNCEFEYQLVGGEDPTDLLNLADELGVSDMIKIIGIIPHTDISDWLDSLDLYIQPSRSEGQGRSILEAMSRACPVVASSVGGIVELLPKECLFPTEDIEELCKKIKFTLKEATRFYEQNYNRALDFSKDQLDVKRQLFYRDFLNNSIK